MKILNLILIIVCPQLFGCSGNPTSQGGGTEIESRAQKLAQETIILDGHVDLPYRLDEKMEDISTRSDLGDFDFVRARKGGLDAPFMSIYVPASLEQAGEAKAKADELIDLVEGIVKSSPGKFQISTQPSQIEENFARGVISLPMGMENGAPIEGDIANLRHFYDRGIRYITLTHSKDNHICDSSYDTTRTWNGLSPFGREVVKEMNWLGIMIDVSHISDSAFYEVMDLSSAPVIASHSSCRHFTPGWERNMSDPMIRALAQNDGVIQINFGSTFISGESKSSWDEMNRVHRAWMEEQGLTADAPEAKEHLDTYRKNNFRYSNVNEVADHIDHVVQLVGINHVGFGSDFDGVGDSLPVGLKDVSGYPNLIAEMLRRGYSEEEVAKVCYKNVFRVWQKVIEISKKSSP